MKKILQGLAVATAVLATNSASAQIPDGGTCPANIVLESYVPSAGYTGNHAYDLGSWKIDSILDAGTTVILDVFATWCPPCWTFHQGGTLDDLYNSAGWGGTGDVAIFAVHASSSTQTFEGGEQGDWVNNTHYPMVDNTTIGSQFNVQGFPTIVMICPDREVINIGRTTEANYISAIGNCGAPASATNDIKLFSTEYVPVVCGGSSIPVTARIQNYGSAAVTSATIKVMEGATEIASQDWTGNIATYETADVNISGVTPTGAGDLTVTISTTDEELTNNAETITIAGPTDLALNTSNNVINLEVGLDNYPGEFGYVFDAGAPTYSNPADAVANVTGLSKAAIGDVTSATYEAVIQTNGPGCYYFAFADDYGDGMSPGSVAIVANETINVNTAWGFGGFMAINATDGGTTGIETSEVSSMNVFPNPATTEANVSLNLNEESNVSISIVNALGQSVYTNNLGNVNGTQNVSINTANLEAGMYLVNITINGVVSTERISVVK